MKLCIANYDNSTSKGGSRNLVIHCNDLNWIAENFGDRKVSATVGGGKITLKVDPHGHSRWGAVSKGRRQISLTHDTDLRLFGATYIPINHIDIKEAGTVVIFIPSEEELVTPIKKKTKPKQPHHVKNISLGDAVRAINSHKKTWGNDLALSIKPDGTLLALIEFS